MFPNTGKPWLSNLISSRMMFLNQFVCKPKQIAKLGLLKDTTNRPDSIEKYNTALSDSLTNRKLKRKLEIEHSSNVMRV